MTMDNPPAAPLSGVRVLDLATGPTGALACTLLTGLGASVTRLKPAGPDPFLESSPMYAMQRSQVATLDFSGDTLHQQLEQADACLLGGDDYPGSTQVPSAARVEELAAAYPSGVFLAISGTVPGSTRGDLPANDLLAQARSGLASEHFSDRPIAFGVALPTYGAVLHGVTALVAALYEREVSGRGEVIRTSLVQGAAAFMTSYWIQDQGSKRKITGKIPKGVRWAMLQCGDGRWITYAQGIPGSTARIHEVVGLTPPEGSENARWSPATEDPAAYFGVTDELAEAFMKWQSADLHRRLVEVGVTAEIVRSPGDCWSDPQVEANRLLVHAEDGGTYVGSPIGFVTGSQL